jgi:hypothetical protein
LGFRSPCLTNLDIQVPSFWRSQNLRIGCLHLSFTLEEFALAF